MYEKERMCFCYTGLFTFPLSGMASNLLCIVSLYTEFWCASAKEKEDGELQPISPQDCNLTYCFQAEGDSASSVSPVKPFVNWGLQSLAQNRVALQLGVPMSNGKPANALLFYIARQLMVQFTSCTMHSNVQLLKSTYFLNLFLDLTW
jgi:hypothetical protein